MKSAADIQGLEVWLFKQGNMALPQSCSLRKEAMRCHWGSEVLQEIPGPCYECIVVLYRWYHQ